MARRALTTFDPQGFFNLGQRLVTSSSGDEAGHRTAIGRAYYACFLTARDQQFGIDQRTLTTSVKKRLKRRKNLGSHEVIIVALSMNKSVRPVVAKRLSDQLGELKDMRIQADYFRDPSHRGTTSVFARYAVSDWLGLAHEAMTLASNLLPDLRKVSP